LWAAREIQLDIGLGFFWGKWGGGAKKRKEKFALIKSICMSTQLANPTPAQINVSVHIL